MTAVTAPAVCIWSMVAMPPKSNLHRLIIKNE
jgi:hypothetical protein